MTAHSQSLITMAADAMLTAFHFGGEQAAIDCLDGFKLDMALTCGEGYFLEPHAMARYRDLQMLHCA